MSDKWFCDCGHDDCACCGPPAGEFVSPPLTWCEKFAKAVREQSAANPRERAEGMKGGV